MSNVKLYISSPSSIYGNQTQASHTTDSHLTIKVYQMGVNDKKFVISEEKIYTLK